MVWQQVGYCGPRHWYEDAFALTPADQFIVYEGTPTAGYEWHYRSINTFGRLIPPHALLALNVVEQAGLRPQAYWVADKYARRTVRVVDPILSGQWGQWLVALAEWL